MAQNYVFIQNFVELCCLKEVGIPLLLVIRYTCFRFGIGGGGLQRWWNKPLEKLFSKTNN